MYVKLKTITPLWVPEHAINTCWDKFNTTSDLVNINKINRVVNKFKHASTIEHCRLTFVLSPNEDGSYPDIYFAALTNPYSIVSKIDQQGTMLVTTNIRALQNMNIDLEEKLVILPDEYKFFVDDNINLDTIKIDRPNYDVDDGVTLLYSTQIEDVMDLNHMSYTYFINNGSRAELQEIARHRVNGISVKSSRYTLTELRNEPMFNIASIIVDIDNDFYNNIDVIRASKYLVYTMDEEVDTNSIIALDNLRSIIKSGKSNDIAKYCMPESYKTELTLTFTHAGLVNFLKLRTDKAALWEIRKLAYKLFNKLPNEYKDYYAKYLYKEEE